MKNKSGEKTLLASVILSSPGSIVVGIGLFVGRSSTQLADFIRRTAELIAILVSWIIYRMTNHKGVIDYGRKVKLERIANQSVGIAMCFSGVIMIIIALFSQKSIDGNVLPGLIIAILGVITNSLFWLKYRKLNRIEPNAILLVQSQLYRAKSLVDLCVMIALLTLLIKPGSSLAHVMDIVGTIIVAIYLIFSGLKTLQQTSTV